MMCDLISQSRPRARVEHECNLCGTAIQPGEEYVRQFVRDCGDVWVFKTCEACEDLISTAADPPDEITTNDVDAWALEMAEQTHEPCSVKVGEAMAVDAYLRRRRADPRCWEPAW